MLSCLKDLNLHVLGGVLLILRVPGFGKHILALLAEEGSFVSLYHRYSPNVQWTLVVRNGLDGRLYRWSRGLRVAWIARTAMGISRCSTS